MCTVTEAMDRFVVIGDLGGTNCRLELLKLPGEGCDLNSKPSPLHRAKYRSDSAPSLVALLQRFAAESGYTAALSAEGGAFIQLYCISVCGAVHCGRATLLATCFGEGGWTVDVKELEAALGAKVAILNDFHAVGLSLGSIERGDILCLYAPPTHDSTLSNGIVACLGPGTGLGEVYSVRLEDPSAGGAAGGLIRTCCSEGGMSDFVARTQDEWELRQFIAHKDGTSFVEVEKVVSGTGIMNAYCWLREKHPEWMQTEESKEIDAAIMAAAEPAGVIASYCTPAIDGQQQIAPGTALCAAAVDVFLTALGAEAGNMAIRHQAKDGVYIAGGGIPHKLAGHIADGRVAGAYLNKGYSVASYDCCPLYLATTPGDDLGLRGAFQFALTLL